MTQDSAVSDTQTQQVKKSATDAPEKLGKYLLKGEIGRGSCGVVYKGFDPFVQRDVAIKVAQQDPTKISAAGTDSGRASFFTEAR
jgi:hypothetical protein